MRRYWPEIAWGVFAAINVWLMFLSVRWETIPFHFVWISLTLLYGVRVWPWRPTAAVLAVTMVATTVGELHPGAGGDVEIAELCEVVLMGLVFLAMVWHARRRQSVMDLLAGSSEREREFLRDASHQLKTPITIARGHAELVQRANTDSEIGEDNAIVIDELERLSRIAERLLTLAAAGHEDFLITEPTQLDILVRHAAERWRPCADRCWEVETSPLRAAADPMRLTVALDAVLENAVQHTEPGDRISVNVTRVGAEACIRVTDSGHGMPLDATERVFRRFARADTGGRRGTGLGLPMARAIAAAHGGDARLSSILHVGTVVELRIPAIA